jgi:hypothetical protein
LETVEFRCSEKLYRIFEVSFLNPSGKVLRSQLMRPPYEWHPIRGSVMETISTSACKLITRESPDARLKSQEQAELNNIAKFALSFHRSLKQSKDFKPLIGKFFAPNYLKGYLADSETNWFLNLSRETAARASRAELHRYYAAILNASYLSSLYLVSQSPANNESGADESLREEHLVPNDVLQMIKHHPYSATYKPKAEMYGYLAENIDTLNRMRSYTDLMERIATLMRNHVIRVKAEQSRGYQGFLEELDLETRVRVCSAACFGLPKGTRLFEITVPIFRLQLAEIEGQLKIVSVRDRSNEANHRW